MFHSASTKSHATLWLLASAHTAFMAEIAIAAPHEMRVRAELAAELAAEHWERANGHPPAETVPSDLTRRVAALLLHNARTMHAARVEAA